MQAMTDKAETSLSIKPKIRRPRKEPFKANKEPH